MSLDRSDELRSSWDPGPGEITCTLRPQHIAKLFDVPAWLLGPWLPLWLCWLTGHWPAFEDSFLLNTKRCGCGHLRSVPIERTWDRGCHRWERFVRWLAPAYCRPRRGWRP